MKARTLLFAAALASCAAFAGSARAAQNVVAQPTGETLYNTRCSSCHGVHLQGSIDAPPLFGKSAADVDFMLRTGRMPAAVPGPQQLPKPAQFDDAQIRSLVAYVISVGHGNAALPTPAAGNAARGRDLFAQNCQACHGVTGHGASVGSSEVAPSLMSVAPIQIAEAIRIGPGVMPAFGTDVVKPRDVDDIVTYVTLLQRQSHANNPGGLQLANIGPVAEGFVGWVFGIGLLVLLCRRIGTTD